MDGTALVHHFKERLSGNRLDDANMSKVIFNECNMTSAEFIKTNLTNSFLRNSVMQNVSITDCGFTECKLKGINFGSKPALMIVKESCFSRSKFIKCDFSQCCFDECKFDASLHEGISFERLMKAKKNLKLAIISFAIIYIASIAALMFLFTLLKK